MAVTERELRIRVLTDQLAEARRIADQLAHPLYLADQQGWLEYVDAGLQDRANEALTAYKERSWR